MPLQGRAMASARLASHLSKQARPSPSRHLRSHFVGSKSSTRLMQRRLQSDYAGTYAEPPRRSLPVRILSGTLRYGLGSALFLALGVAIGLATLRNRGDADAGGSGAGSMVDALLARKPPSDAETLELYAPPAGDAQLAQINTHIVTHPLAAALRARPDFVESRPHMKLPPALRQANLTGGTLAGAGKIAVPPLTFVERDGRALVAIFYLGGQLCGHPGLVHGGLLATLLDEGLARCCFPALPNKVGVTASLKIDYRQPVPADGYYVLRARTERVEGRKAWVRGWLEPLQEGSAEQGPPVGAGADAGASAAVAVSPPAGNGAEQQQENGKEGEQQEGGGAAAKAGSRKMVEAEALFIEPRNAKVIKRIYSPD